MPNDSAPTSAPPIATPPRTPTVDDLEEGVPAQPIENFTELPWPQRLKLITRMMREVSSITDPQQMVHTYGGWVQAISPIDRFVSLSRRDLATPHYRITRSGLWDDQNRDEVNPWTTPMPMFASGVLGELIYAGEPIILDDFACPPGDAACEHIDGYRSLMAIPLFENGVALNMIILLKRERAAFDREELANRVWNSNLFGRATRNLVLNAELGRAYDVVDRELKVVADIQRSLLPKSLPRVAGLELAAHYQTSAQSGGDYYDFFELDDGRLGMLIADVSGHGTPAAVMMAVTHSIAHTREREPAPPCELLAFLNERLCARYTNNGTFITAFYGVYDPRDRSLRYCNAGHNAPIVRRTGGSGAAETILLDQNGSLPLGIVADETYVDATVTLAPGDWLVLYTDGITEARKAGDPSELFGLDRLINVLCRCAADPQAIIEQTVRSVNDWTDFARPTDDRTLVVGKLT